jgi:excisionase family DNA binding protein
MSVLTLTEAAAFLKIGAKTVERLARENKIPAKKVGGRIWRFSEDKLKAWLESDDAVEKTETEKPKNVVSFSTVAQANTAKAYQDVLASKCK